MTAEAASMLRTEWRGEPHLEASRKLGRRGALRPEPEKTADPKNNDQIISEGTLIMR